MNFFEKLEEAQKAKNSLVCVGLDTDIKKIPKHLLTDSDAIFSFNKAIIDATREFASTYKANIPFYAAEGSAGLESLKKTVDYVHSLGIPIIVDAKRNDIGNTAELYAREIFGNFGFDAMTVNPYMGEDSVRPFLAHKEKGIFILTKTSNPGSADFQDLIFEGKPLYQHVVEKTISWDDNHNAGFVVGATAPEQLLEVRKLAPESTLLIPGIGKQGGDLVGTLKNGLREDKLGLIINSSRGIIYASDGEDFAERAGEEAKKLRDEINRCR